MTPTPPEAPEPEQTPEQRIAELERELWLTRRNAKTNDDVSAAVMETLRAQLAASEKDRQWQPIETAPKDGTFVLLVEESGHTHICQWYSEGGYWRSRIMDGDLKWEPTHWMPLPKAPDAAMKEAK